MKKVVVYSDQGVDGGALKQLIRSLQAELDPNFYSIIRMNAKTLIEEPWENETALFIIPGGRDIFYHALLETKGTEKIRRYVEKGGSYLGICAGAYFASSFIEFEKGGVHEICAERSLKFFPGVARGSAYGLNKYSCENASGAEAAMIRSEYGDCPIYFSGGCLFDSKEDSAYIKTIGHYLDLPGKPPAILEIRYGLGAVILSGVHVEYSPSLLNREDPHLASICSKLEPKESLRRTIFRSYLKYLFSRPVPLNI